MIGGTDPEVTTDLPGWPTPDAMMYSGLAGEIVRTIAPNTEADPVALLIDLLLSFGNAMGRASYCQVGAARHHLNEFAILVGRTAGGRKGTARREIAAVMREADHSWADTCQASGLSSGEGLIHHVRDEGRDSRRRNTVRREADEVESDQGVMDKRLLVAEQEFASTLKVMTREGSTLSAVIRQAWDGDRLRILTKNSPIVATDAHISIIGHITADEFRRELTHTDTANGFVNRFLIACVRRSRCLPDGGALAMMDRERLGRDLRGSLVHARSTGEIRRDSGARKYWQDVYPDLSEARPGLLGAALGRAEAHVLRLGALYALLDGGRVVSTMHLESALALWKYCEDSAAFVFGRSLGDPVADTLLAEMQSRGKMTRTEISQLFHGHRQKAQIDAALMTLVGQGLIERTQVRTPGRSIEEWTTRLISSHSPQTASLPNVMSGEADVGERSETTRYGGWRGKHLPREEGKEREERVGVGG